MRRPKIKEWMVTVTRAFPDSSGTWRFRFWWNAERTSFREAKEKSNNRAVVLNNYVLVTLFLDQTLTAFDIDDEALAAMEITDGSGDGAVFYYEWP